MEFDTVLMESCKRLDRVPIEPVGSFKPWSSRCDWQIAECCTELCRCIWFMITSRTSKCPWIRSLCIFMNPGGLQQTCSLFVFGACSGVCSNSSLAFGDFQQNLSPVSPDESSGTSARIGSSTVRVSPSTQWLLAAPSLAGDSIRHLHTLICTCLKGNFGRLVQEACSVQYFRSSSNYPFIWQFNFSASINSPPAAIHLAKWILAPVLVSSARIPCQLLPI